MPDWLPRKAHIPRNRSRPRGTGLEINFGLRKLWDATAYLMRSPANAAAILEAVEQLDRWRERRGAPPRAPPRPLRPGGTGAPPGLGCAPPRHNPPGKQTHTG